MSPCYEQACVAIHFTWKQDWPAVSKLLPVIEKELAPFKARPHWGKLFTMSPSQLRSRYEKLPEFIRLARKYDPQGKFRNEFLDQNIFGRGIVSKSPGGMVMPIQPGDRFPEATFTRMTESGPAPVSSAELFAGKKVVLFGVPGAFTPTCSKKHLPGYVEEADALKAKGVDLIACMSVNDAFVMDAWGRGPRRVGDKVLMLADGNGDVTRQIGPRVGLLEVRDGPARAAASR